jgi:class 3 adenylate cyclase
MSDLPTGIVTFLFTDIQGSTKLSQEYPSDMPVLLARHNEILRHAIETHNGFVFQVVGDSFSAAFLERTATITHGSLVPRAHQGAHGHPYRHSPAGNGLAGECI